MSTRQRENRKNGNQESSSKEASEEGSQENSKEEVSKQRNRQHNRGTPKASPDVFVSNAVSPVFMHLRRHSMFEIPVKSTRGAILPVARMPSELAMPSLFTHFAVGVRAVVPIDNGRQSLGSCRMEREWSSQVTG